MPTLAGQHVVLVPLAESHSDALAEVGLDPAIWEWMPLRVRDRDGMRAVVRESIRGAAAGTEIPFATTLQSTGQVVGTTRFMSLALAHRRLEIGWTWIAPAWQRSPVNTEAKYLMLHHAFEALQCMRVEFKTNVLNVRSRAAIARLGAQEEGVFRKHMLNEDGSVRDSVYFSIVDDEWPAVKARLEAKLQR